MAEEAATEPLTEAKKLARWRAEICSALGLNSDQTLRVVSNELDVAELRKLLGAGCPFEVAVRILRR